MHTCAQPNLRGRLESMRLIRSAQYAHACLRARARRRIAPINAQPCAFFGDKRDEHARMRLHIKQLSGMHESEDTKKKRHLFQVSRHDPTSAFNTPTTGLQEVLEFQERARYRLLAHRRRSIHATASLDEPEAPNQPITPKRQLSLRLKTRGRVPTSHLSPFQYSDLSSVHRSFSSSLSGSPIVRCRDDVGEEQVEGAVHMESLRDTSAHSPSPCPPQPSSKQSSTPKAALDPSVSVLQRTASLGLTDSHRFSRFRPASLSVTVPSPTHFLSSTEAVGGKGETGAPATAATASPAGLGCSSPAPPVGASASPFSISPQCSFMERQRRRSGERGSGVRLAGSVWPAAASSTGASSMSHRSSLLLMPPAYQAQLSNPPSIASPGPSGYASLTSELLFHFYSI